MNKMTWAEATTYLRQFNKAHGITLQGQDGPSCTMAVVFTPDSFDKEYSLDARTYLIHNSSKAFLPNLGGYSMFSNCLDGTDDGVRLEQYVKEEGRGGTWKVDYCYIYREEV